jgi:tight adherence protein C
MPNAYEILIITLLVFALVTVFLDTLDSSIHYRHAKIMNRLRNMDLQQVTNPDDILSQPFRERTLGYLSRRIVDGINQITPSRIKEQVEQRLKRAGNPYGTKSGDFLGMLSILGLAVLAGSIMLMLGKGTPLFSVLIRSVCFTALAVYLPWFILGLTVVKRQKEIQRTLPEIIDLLVINVEAGLGFDLALAKVAKRYPGAIAEEFQQALFEMQLGKTRKDALQGVSNRVNLEEVSILVNSVVQSDQLGVGLGHTLRMQSDLIREKRRLWVEEQAMKAPVKMLFPLVFFMFPCMFIIILGPALINIFHTLGK